MEGGEAVASVDYVDEMLGDGTLAKLRGFDVEGIDEETPSQVKQYHNPGGDPTGPYSGRCGRCHSDRVWAGRDGSLRLRHMLGRAGLREYSAEARRQSRHGLSAKLAVAEHDEA